MLSNHPVTSSHDVIKQANDMTQWILHMSVINQTNDNMLAGAWIQYHNFYNKPIGILDLMMDYDKLGIKDVIQRK